jgi:chromate transporter
VAPDAARLPSFRDALRVWVTVGLNSFGGPAGQIAVMHRLLVEQRHWIGEQRFLHALNYCMLLPGPEAQQLATYIGWLLHGYRGGLAAGALFVLPGFVAILALSLLYVWAQDVGLVNVLLFGLKAAVLAVVAEAVLRIGRRVLHNAVLIALAAFAFVALYFFECPFPLVIAAAAGVGYVGARSAPALFLVPSSHGAAPRAPAALDHLLDAGRAGHIEPSWGRALRVVAVFGLLWLGPIAGLWWWLGGTHVFVAEAVFFSKAAVVTFGGAYAVLAYMAQQAVETYHWLAPGEMLDGLGMAETTPGPLIQVVQFVGFLGAYRDPGTLHPLLAGCLGAVLTTWVTFVPCFLWIFLGAPYVERLRANTRLGGALSAITASVVGVISNLAVWFGLHVLFAEVATRHGPLGVRLLVPDWGTLDGAAALLAAGSFIALVRFKQPLIPTLLASASLGALYRLVV